MGKYSKKQYIVAGVAALAIVGAAGGAYAYWTNSGTGSGTAATTSSTAFTVTVDNNTAGDLSPAGPTDTVTYHVKNVDSGTEYLTSTTPTVTSTSNAGCTAADFAITANTITTGAITSGSTVDGSFKIQMKDTGVNQNACKNVTVNLQVAAA